MDDTDRQSVIAMVVRAAVDERYGDGTSTMIDEVMDGVSTHHSIAVTLGVSRQSITRRINKAKVYARRLLHMAGVAEAGAAVKA